LHAGDAFNGRAKTVNRKAGHKEGGDFRKKGGVKKGWEFERGEEVGNKYAWKCKSF